MSTNDQTRDADKRLAHLTAERERALGEHAAWREADRALTAALAQAQGKFPAIPKGKTATIRPRNGGAPYTYSYADLADVLAVVRPVLAEHGLAITQRTVRDGGAVILETELRHEAGGSITTEVVLTASPGDVQAFGSALTYLRRYELVTLLGLSPEDDRDGNTTGDGDPPPPDDGMSDEQRLAAMPATEPEARLARDAVAYLLNAAGPDAPLEGDEAYEAVANVLDPVQGAYGGVLPRAAVAAIYHLATAYRARALQAVRAEGEAPS
jgi:hypothetical protein